MKRTNIVTSLIGLWLLIVLLACNLSAPEPPTLVPRASATPPPTIGYATLSPEEIPDVVTTPIPQSENALITLLNRVETDRMMRHIQVLQDMGTRHVNSPTNQPNYGVGGARDYIRQQFTEIREQYPDSSFTVLDNHFPTSWGGVHTTGTNVVGFLPGTEVGAGIFLLGAHYDSIVNSGWEDGNALAPGANDNASGVASLLEIARVLASGIKPRSTVIFVAFAAEEVQRQGSKAFVATYIQPNNIIIDGMMNLDIIGGGRGPDGSINDRQIRLFSEGPNESAARQLARQMNLLSFIYVPEMEVVLQDAQDRDGRYGDHMSFAEVGFPAIRFTEILEDPNRQHNTRDTIDAISPTYLTRSTKVILAGTAAIVGGPRAPQNRVLRDNGNGTRTLVWEPVPNATSYIVALRYPGSLVYNQYFETYETSITSEIFTSDRLASIAIAGRNESGLIGPLSGEYFITN